MVSETCREAKSVRKRKGRKHGEERGRGKTREKR